MFFLCTLDGYVSLSASINKGNKRINAHNQDARSVERSQRTVGFRWICHGEIGKARDGQPNSPYHLILLTRTGESFFLFLPAFGVPHFLFCVFLPSFSHFSIHICSTNSDLSIPSSLLFLSLSGMHARFVTSTLTGSARVIKAGHPRAASLAFTVPTVRKCKSTHVNLSNQSWIGY